MKNAETEVRYHGKTVGFLAKGANHRFVFAYADTWLENGYSISPFSLPLKPDVFVPQGMNFGGLWGVFADSLPDAWGRLLADRMLLRHGIDPAGLSQTDRLAIVGESGMGGLTYHPVRGSVGDRSWGDLDELATECQSLLRHEEITDPDRMFRLGGSSGGARPKVMSDEWIVKFPASGDMSDVGLMEKEYADAAVACGITVPETRLMPSSLCSGYFAVRRFDRETQADEVVRHHVLTAAAILEADWRNVAMDYHTLMKLTNILSRSNRADTEQMYRRMCFNVFAHNRDDHAKNFSWIHDDINDCWHLSPAYDLTWSTTYWGEHSTTVNGNGQDPGIADLIEVGRKAGLSPAKCKLIAADIQSVCRPLEEKWRNIRS